MGLSIVLPVRNGGETIERAVRSTLRAMPEESSELIVGCDGCTDNTSGRLENIRDPRLRIIAYDEPIGIAATLNLLIGMSTYATVARMDADDVCMPWRFRHQLRIFRPGSILFSNVLHFGSGFRVPRPVAPVQLGPSSISGLLLLENPVAHPTMIADREVLRTLGGYRNVPAEDYDLWMRAAARGVPLVRDRVHCLAYRHHTNQVTKNRAFMRRRSSSRELSEVHKILSGKVLGTRYGVWQYLTGGLGQQDSCHLAQEYSRFRSELVDFASQLPRLDRYALLRGVRRADQRVFGDRYRV